MSHPASDDLDSADYHSLREAIVNRNAYSIRQVLEKRPHSKKVDDLKQKILCGNASSSSPFMSFEIIYALTDIPIIDTEDAEGPHLASLNICDETGCNSYVKALENYSALFTAVRSNNVEMVKSLLKNFENTNHKIFRGRTPLHLSAMFGHCDISGIFLEKGANPRLTDEEHRLPLHWACENTHADVAHLLVKADSSTINHQDKNGITPLMLAAESNDSEGVRMLLENGAKVDICNRRGQMALHSVAESGNAALLEFMLKSTDANCIQNAGCIQKWTSTKNVDVYKFGSSVSLACCAISSGNIECLKVLLSSKLSESFLRMPHISYGKVFPPLAYLFECQQYCDEKLNAFLQVLLKHKKIIVFNDFKADWLRGYKSFKHPFSFIIDSSLPFARKQYYLDLLSANQVTMDYCLQCYYNNRQPFSSFTNYIDFYELLLRAFFAKDMEIMKLVMSTSVILEPDQIIVLLISLIPHMMPEAWVKAKALPDIYRYLISLKPIYFVNAKHPCSIRYPHPPPQYPYSSPKDEFAVSKLQQLCRTAIRHHLRDYTLEDNLRNFKRKIMELPLAPLLKNYLLFQN